MKTLPRIAGLLLLTATAMAHSHHTHTETPVPWKGEIAPEPPQLQFVVLPDRTGGEREGVYARVMERINLMQPDFIVSIGDLIEGGTEDTTKIEQQWNEFEALTDPLEMPMFYCAGNHDISNETMHKAWHKRFGASWYNFRHRDVLFLILNSEDRTDWSGDADMSPEQVADAIAAIEANPDARWTCVFMHRPIWGHSSGFGKIEQALADRPYTVFVGHQHNYKKDERLGHNYYVLSTAGGISQLRGPLAGEFDHLMWVTMLDDGPRVANLMIDGVWSDDIASEVRERMTALTDRPERLLGTEVVLIDSPQHGHAPLILKNPTDAPIKININNTTVALAPGERRCMNLPVEWKGDTPGTLELTGKITFGPGLTYAVEVPLAATLFPRAPFTGQRWEFNSDMAEWNVYGDCAPSITNGILNIGATGNLPIIYADFPATAPRGPLSVRLRLRSTTETKVTLYWDCDISGERSAVVSSHIAIDPDSEWHEVTLPFHPASAISRIALGGDLLIDWIELQPAE